MVRKKKELFTLTQTTFDVGGDGTQSYSVKLNKAHCTLRDFILYAIKRNSMPELDHPDWGNFNICIQDAAAKRNKDVLILDYKDGVLLSPLPNMIANLEVLEVRAHGGYSRMDYFLTV